MGDSCRWPHEGFGLLPWLLRRHQPPSRGPTHGGPGRKAGNKRLAELLAHLTTDAPGDAIDDTTDDGPKDRGYHQAHGHQDEGMSHGHPWVIGRSPPAT